MSNYILIKPCDIANGLGCRVVIFLSGCPHHCHNCHNPQTWDKDNGKPFTEDTMNLLREYLNHEYISGITISGGDPLYMYNLDTTNSIVDMVKNEFSNKNIWIYTGYNFDYDISSDIKKWDIVKKINILVDGKYIEKLHDVSYVYAGSTNQRLIDIQATIKKNKDRYGEKALIISSSVVIFDYKKEN